MPSSPTSSKPFPCVTDLSSDTISEPQLVILSSSVSFVATSDVLLSLPNLKQLETGEFDLDELVKQLTGALADDFQRNEIRQLTGDTGVLVIECLDKVCQVGKGPWITSLITP